MKVGSNMLGNHVERVTHTMECGIEYICPKCGYLLTAKVYSLLCQQCGREYLVDDGVPDFIHEDLSQSEHPVLKSISHLDRLAKIYETKLWYPIVYHLYGGLFIPSVKEEIRIITEMVDAEDGVILDAACGTGLFTRSVARRARIVYGIDISKGMLKQAVKYARKENLTNIKFARAKAEELPFPDAFFDGVVCCGALHLFPDTVQALEEMNRVMKSRSKIAVMTFVKRRFFRFKRIREHLKKSHGVRIFGVEDLNLYLRQTGFQDFRYHIYGSMILFEAKKVCETGHHY